MPNGRVVSAANYQSWVLGFDPSCNPNVILEESRVSNNTLLVILNLIKIFVIKIFFFKQIKLKKLRRSRTYIFAATHMLK